MTPEEHERFSAAIYAAGFFTTGLEKHGGFRRTCVASKKRRGGGYTGNSFWVGWIGGETYVGTMGYEVYRLPDGLRLVELCVEWLTRVPDTPKHFFDEQLVREFCLIHLQQGESQRIVDDAVASDSTANGT